MESTQLLWLLTNVLMLVFLLMRAEILAGALIKSERRAVQAKEDSLQNRLCKKM